MLLKGGGREVKVLATWHAEGGSKASSIGETLSMGRRELGVKEGVYCIAGPEEGGWGMADLLMPELKPAELRSALAFEVRKRTPVALEHLQWGYRVLPEEVVQDGNAKGKVAVRLFYAKTDIWRKWVEAASGLGHLDMLAAAPVLLDPLMQGEAVLIPGEASFRYLPGKVGRDMLPVSADDFKVSSLHDCLPYEKLSLGELEKKPVDEQLSYLKVIIMALYGLGKDVDKDSKTMPPLPEKLKPARYVACRFIAACLVCLILAMLGAGIVSSLQKRVARLRLIRADISKVEAEIARLNGMDSTKANQAAKDFESEISKYTFDAPELPDVLIEVTQLVKPPAWVSGSFDWKTSLGETVVPVTFTIREPVGDSANLDLCKRLNDSPILGDAQELKSTMLRDNKQERRITLKARYDTAEEREYVEREQAELRARQAEEARKAAEAARQAAQDNVQGENEGDNGEGNNPQPPPGDNAVDNDVE